MTPEFYRLFPTLVSRIPQFLTHMECVAAHKHLLSLDIAAPHSAMIGDQTSSHGVKRNIINDLGLTNKVQDALDMYSKEHGRERVYVQNSWYSTMNEGATLKQHMHADAIVAAVIYIHVPSGSNKLYFENPNTMVQYSNRVKEANDTNWEWYSFDAVEGTMIIFPAWLIHGSYYEKNQSNGRMIVSLNADYNTP